MSCWFGFRATAVLVVVLMFSSCAGIPDKFIPWRKGKDTRISQLEVQGAVMEMADDYIAALGEATYMGAAEARQNPRARTLSQSFLRNGVGAAIDIAAGPNPNVALLDLMVLTSLQAWSYEHHWIPSGIGEEAGAASLDRLKQAEEDVWSAAARILKPEQCDTVRGLVEAWTVAHPDRMVVSLVRFNEFTDARRTQQEERRHLALNLLVDLDSATSSVDDARLLGERVLWFSGRYPYVLGEQLELTMYRLADQPEMQKALSSLEAANSLGETFDAQSTRLLQEITEQRQAAFDQLGAERKAAIAQAGDSLAAVIREATDQAFARFAEEKASLLQDIDNRQAQLGETIGDLSEVIAASTVLAQELNKTATAFEQVVRYFEPDPNSSGESMDMADLRDAASETAKAAEQLTLMLAQANDMMLSEGIEGRIRDIDAIAEQRMNQIFWRGLVLVIVLLAGMALIRLIPARQGRK